MTCFLWLILRPYRKRKHYFRKFVLSGIDFQTITFPI